MRKSILLVFYYGFINYSLAQTLTPTFSNIDYVGKSDIRQKLDIYIPPGLKAAAPVIIFIHGGGWSSGSKGSGNLPYFEPSYNSGFVCVDINYRLSGDAPWPAQIEDCKTAIRFLKANASVYNLDTCRFGVIGGSAGGHLSAMVGTSAEVSSLEGLYQGYSNVSSRVHAVVDMYGPTDFLLMDGYYSSACAGKSLYHEMNSFETHLLNIDALHKYPEIVQTANPIAYITPDDPHFFIIHGAEDCSVPTYQSELLFDALKAAGIPADTLIKVPRQGHGGPYFQHPDRATMYKDFFVKYLSSTCSIDNEAVYFIVPAKNIDSYINGASLATVADSDGSITSAVSTGVLPAGTSLNPVTGTITVTDNAKLTPDNNAFNVTTTDSKGGTTIQAVKIIFSADTEAIYTMTTSLSLDSISNGSKLASVTDADGPVIDASILSGKLPDGSSIDPVNGRISVTDKSKLSSGNYEVNVATTDSTGGITNQLVTIAIPKAQEIITETSNQLSSNSISVFPNPANKEITISLAGEDFTIEILNAVGVVVLKTENQQSIGISHLSNGLFILKVRSKNGFYLSKFIKQ